MADRRAAALYSKLAPLPFNALERAVSFTERRRHARVELSHWLHAMLQEDASDLHVILDRFEVERSRLERDLDRALERLPAGAGMVPTFSAQLRRAVEQGWFTASILFSDKRIRFGHLLAGILRDPDLEPVLGTLSSELEKLQLEPLLGDFASITEGSPETLTTAPAVADTERGPAAGAGGALDRFTIDLTAEAKAGRIDPIVGRDDEIRQCVDILMRRRQNNPILTGEAGVGKTSVVEGLARRIAARDVPTPLQGVRLLTLDLGLLQAGAGVKGEFEQRLRNVVDDVQASPEPVVLFIDEAHTLMGAGGQAGTGDAANLLKPLLARGTLRTIAATTWREYKKYIETDAALTRRFQIIHVDEPDEARCVLMLRQLAATLEAHHQVEVLDTAVEAAVRLSRRYITGRQLPDKAVSVLDTACARVAVSRHGAPPALEAVERRLDALAMERDRLARDGDLGLAVTDRIQDVEAEIDVAGRERARLHERHAAEKSAVDQVLALRARLQTDGASTAADMDDDERQSMRQELGAAQASLDALQDEAPMVLAGVDPRAVAAVVADWTGIPVGRMIKDEIETVLRLEDELGRRVIGQDHALAMIARRIRTARAGLDNPHKPIGVFLLCGPSGVGKTETALALAEAVHGGEDKLITINMSEFQEAHTVSTLKGSPPGYVGYGEGGVLTEAVRRKPYSVVLLDEIEKAHPDVHELFFHVFDKGMMEDGEGRHIDFKNTVIILTSNVGSELIQRSWSSAAAAASLDEALRPELRKVFPAALLGRLVVIPYKPLDATMMDAIVRLQLERISHRFQQRDMLFHFDDAVVHYVRERANEAESGARIVDNILTNTLLPQMSREVLLRLRDEAPVRRVEVRVEGGELAYDFS